MSEADRKPDDRELEQFLAGDSAVSRRYRDALGSQPAPPELDRSVLDFAREEMALHSRRRPRWQRPLALAASLLLGFAVLLSLYRDPQSRHQAMLAPTPDAPPAPIESESVERQQGLRRDAAPLPHRPEEEKRSAKPEAAPGRSSLPAAPKASMEAPAIAPAGALPPPPPPAAAFSAAPQSRSRLADAEPSQELRAYSKREEATASAEATMVWQTASFQGLVLGEATRATVRARLGEPGSKGEPASQQQESGGESQLFDRYERVPGIDGEVEFYYERVSEKLLMVRVRLPADTHLMTLLHRLDWNEPPTIERGSQGPCHPMGDTADDAPEYPRYLLFPARGAYVTSTAPAIATELVFERFCP